MNFHKDLFCVKRDRCWGKLSERCLVKNLVNTQITNYTSGNRRRYHLSSSAGAHNLTQVVARLGSHPIPFAIRIVCVDESEIASHGDLCAELAANRVAQF